MRERLAPDREGQEARPDDALDRFRAFATGGMVASLRPGTVMDPACGDGAIVRHANDLAHIAKGYLADHDRARIEALSLAFVNTIRLADIWIAMRDFPVVDLVILTQILEHLDDPDAVLKLARRKGRLLVASSPQMKDGQTDPEPAHRWMFDRQGYGDMLTGAGWEITGQATFSFTDTDFGVWVCR